MSRQEQKAESQTHKQDRQKNKPDDSSKYTAGQDVLDGYLYSLIGSTHDPSIQLQTILEKKPRLQTAQQQQIFSEIAQKQSNTYAQRLIATFHPESKEGKQRNTSSSARLKKTVNTTNPTDIIQRSPLSEELESLWNPVSPGGFFDRLRNLTPQERADADLRRFVNTSDQLSGDDRWLAQRILQHGPEPLWPLQDLQERHRRAAANRWNPEAGGITATLTAQNQGEKAETTAYFFPGTSTERALIIGGMHGSELSAVQVAEQLVDTLRAGRGPRPYFTVIIVPRLFAANIARAESTAVAQPESINSPENIGRFTQQSPPSTDPNRQFPTAGRALDPTNPVDAEGRPIEPANIILLELIQRFQPSRVANLHAIRNAADAGIYADPRANAQGLAYGFTSDRDLALAMSARAAGARARRLRGNRRSRRPDVNAIYPRDPPAVAAGLTQPRSRAGGSAAYQRGTSFGTWGTTEVREPTRPELNRPAMTVITVEVATAYRVEDRAATQQAARRAEIGSHASALQEIFLGEPGAGGRPSAPISGPLPPQPQPTLSRKMVAMYPASPDLQEHDNLTGFVQRRGSEMVFSVEEATTGRTVDVSTRAVLPPVARILEGEEVETVTSGRTQLEGELENYRLALWDFYKGVQGRETRDGAQVEALGARRRFWLETGMRRIAPLLDWMDSQGADARVFSARYIRGPVSRWLAQADIEVRPGRAGGGQDQARADELRRLFPQGISVVLTVPRALPGGAATVPANQITSHAYEVGSSPPPRGLGIPQATLRLKVQQGNATIISALQRLDYINEETITVSAQRFAAEHNAVALRGDQIVTGQYMVFNNQGEIAPSINRIYQRVLALLRDFPPTSGNGPAPEQVAMIRALIFVAHGLPHDMRGHFAGTGARFVQSQVREVMAAISPVLTSDVRVRLFACLTASSGEGGFADAVRDALAPEHGQALVIGHRIAGRVLENVNVRFFYAAGERWEIEDLMTDAFMAKEALRLGVVPENQTPSPKVIQAVRRELRGSMVAFWGQEAFLGNLPAMQGEHPDRTAVMVNLQQAWQRHQPPDPDLAQRIRRRAGLR